MSEKFTKGQAMAAALKDMFDALTKARGLVAKEVEDRGVNDSEYWISARQTLAEIDTALSKARGEME